MKVKARRHYSKVFHYYFKSGFLNEDQFKVLSTLTEDDILVLFGERLKTIKELLIDLAHCIKYQKSKYSVDGQWLDYKKKLPRTVLLWSNSIDLDRKLFSSIDNLSDFELGLGLLFVVDHKLAIVWGLRLKTHVDQLLFESVNKSRAKGLFLQIYSPVRINLPENEENEVVSDG